MSKDYIDVPIYTTINDIEKKEYTLSATQYKTFNIKNKNIIKIRDFLDRDLSNKDSGNDPGSDAYVKKSNYIFIKTKALQNYSYLLDKTKDSIEYITPYAFENHNLKKGDLLISKDSNVGEIVILDKDYSNAMLCGGIYKLPITKNKYYLLAFIKNSIVREQIDFMVPRGSTIRHGKTMFLECKIPMPNKNSNNTIKYIEDLTKAIIDKEQEIQKKHDEILELIEDELKNNQKNEKYTYKLPNINDITDLDRMDSALYTKEFKQKEFLITNYLYGTSSIEELGFEKPSRGQNLQISNIGKSIYSSKKLNGYYRVILPKYLSKYGTVKTEEYIGNKNKLKTLEKGDIIFGAEGNEKGRSLVVLEKQDNTITNIHGITLKQRKHDKTKGIFVKLFLDYLRNNGMIDAYAVGGNGGSLAIKYWKYLRFPNFPEEKEKSITDLYFNNLDEYKIDSDNMENFIEFDKEYNKKAGIYELDKSKLYLQNLLDDAIEKIANDIEINEFFDMPQIKLTKNNNI